MTVQNAGCFLPELFRFIYEDRSWSYTVPLEELGETGDNDEVNIGISNEENDPEYDAH